MKTTVKQFKKLIREALTKRLEGLNRERRGKKKNYGELEDEGGGVTYGDLPEDVDRLRRAKDKYGETEFEEGMNPETGQWEHEPMPGLGQGMHQSRMERERGVSRGMNPQTKELGGEGPWGPRSDVEDFFHNDSDKFKWDESNINEKAPPSEEAEEFIKKHKKEFIKRYGAKEGMKNLYATAWEKFGG